MANHTLVNETQPLTQGSEQPNQTISMYVNSKTYILLQTCIALAANPNQVQSQVKHHVRLILDSGSQKKYITQQLKKTLDLKPTVRERLCIKTFGSDYNLNIVYIVILCLKDVNN